jgi:hypothetical protein
MNQYMLLMTGQTKAWKALSPEENQRIMERYLAFVDALCAEQKFVGGSPLKEGGYGLRSDGSRVRIDGPFSETKVVLIGYMIFKASDFDEALEIAKRCPALTHGESVEVFELSGH